MVSLTHWPRQSRPYGSLLIDPISLEVCGLADAALLFLALTDPYFCSQNYDESQSLFEDILTKDPYRLEVRGGRRRRRVIIPYC